MPYYHNFNMNNIIMINNNSQNRIKTTRVIKKNMKNNKIKQYEDKRIRLIKN